MDIDKICRLLDCTPGEAPGRVEGLLLGYPGDAPPKDERNVIVFLDGVFSVGWYADNVGWWYIEDSPVYEVDRWWGLPVAPGSEQCSP